jgi:hypothetical protein
LKNAWFNFYSGSLQFQLHHSRPGVKYLHDE